MLEAYTYSANILLEMDLLAASFNALSTRRSQACALVLLMSHLTWNDWEPVDTTSCRNTNTSQKCLWICFVIVTNVLCISQACAYLLLITKYNLFLLAMRRKITPNTLSPNIVCFDKASAVDILRYINYIEFHM